MRSDSKDVVDGGVVCSGSRGVIGFFSPATMPNQWIVRMLRVDALHRNIRSTCMNGMLNPSSS
jgi:hypothetical protein